MTKPSTLQMANQGATANKVLNWFEEYIAQNQIQIGDPLPSEDQIVEMTGISRTCVREAITRLRSIGIVESKRKRGMRLTRSIQLLDFVRMLVNDHPSREDIGHLGGFRSAIELGLLPEIFRCVGEKEINDLERVYTQMEQNLHDDNIWGVCDMEFHAILVQATGNKMAGWYCQMLQPFYRQVVTATGESRSLALAKHRAIIDALIKHDPFAFEQAMRDHHLVKLNPQSSAYDFSK